MVDAFVFISNTRGNHQKEMHLCSVEPANVGLKVVTLSKAVRIGFGLGGIPDRSATFEFVGNTGALVAPVISGLI